MAEGNVKEEPFPAPSRREVGLVDGIETEVTKTSFSDKIMITLSQGGRLAQWIQVPLSESSAANMDMALPPVSSDLPSVHLTPRTLIGGGSEDRETLGQLYASQIGSFIALQNPQEERTLLLGLGLEKATSTREGFFDVIELVQKVL
ncbi:hypothetical protein B0T18DRAFT_363150 [Schizothecium vesticola]|uniref:Proteasome assembly chaperone 3 n=1 Tax=Schizothecium vesticola TaxID=314040 RepID=A0AA40F6Y0_9PEZI|nr:hypothetical protein B0T18DRAFT_363150 [Schizothecium vesticola]